MYITLLSLKNRLKAIPNSKNKGTKSTMFDTRYANTSNDVAYIDPANNAATAAQDAHLKD